jgi:O-antigen ligase
VDNLKDTHNWYVKVMVETGIIGLVIVMVMLGQMVALAYRLFKKAEDPLYRGLGLGLLLAICSCIIANFFGDRWTYLEITGPLWVLVGVALCATHLPEEQAAKERIADEPATAVNPYLVYR